MRPLRFKHLPWLLAIACSCSLNDLSYLQSDLGDGGSNAHGGASGSSQTATSGQHAGGAATATSGGASVRGGASAKGGAGSGGTSSAGGSAGTGGSDAFGGTTGNPAIPYGPWTFDSAADIPLNWIKGRAGVRVGWVAEGETSPLGALTLDSSGSSNIADIRHTIDPTNLSKETITARVRMAYGETTVQFYATTATTYGSGYSSPVPVSTDWTTITWSFNQPATTSGIYDPTKITFILLLLNGAGVLWIDGISISPPIDVPVGTGGSTSG
jgi:hypothetical protein